MILFFPLFVYFAAKQVMEDSFDFVPPTSVLAPAIMAVAAVNIIIVAYVVKAFREEQLQEKNKTEWRGTFPYLCAFAVLWFLRSLLP